MRRTFHSLPVLFFFFTFYVIQLPSSSYAVNYTVTLDTRSLASEPAPPAPFSLEFQLNDGDGTVNNTITLSNFNFGTGGSATGSPTTTGGASGNLSSTVTLTDSSFFNEFIQGFTPSSTDPLSFLFDLTTNEEPITPDSFSLAIFDSSGIGIPTSFFDVFLQADITSPLIINTYASDASLSPPGCPTCAAIEIPSLLVTTDTSPVPEPSTIVLLTSALSVMALRRRR